ncbi:MAG: SigB/SigF/SigG family RNA polymerase sigma factor [Clostridia bacterium]|nr:SigB/SigF/SigG family RNA polymerase sigma factor [Clostridia bacterium]
MFDENLALILLAKNGDSDAKNDLINQNYPLIKSVIKRYKNKGVDYCDLFQLGCVGFVKAINNFDASFGVKFSTYAVPMIAGEVKRFLRDDGTIKVSRALKTLSIQIKKFIDLKQNQGIKPSLEEIASHFNVDVQEVVFAMDASIYPVSLFSSVDGDDDSGSTLADCIEAKDDFKQNLDHIVLKDLIKKLNERERKIIIMRYYRDKTQSQIAKELNVSQVQVSRIENKVLEKFKKELKVD